MEYVIKGNAAVLKCSIPSFVADFVRVESWIDEEGTELRHSEDYGTTLFQKLNLARLVVTYSIQLGSDHPPLTSPISFIFSFINLSFTFACFSGQSVL